MELLFAFHFYTFFTSTTFFDILNRCRSCSVWMIGYKEDDRLLTRSQVKVIVQYLGEL